MKLQCGILFVLLNVAVALAQTGCKNARIDLAVVIDSTMKDGIREPLFLAAKKRQGRKMKQPRTSYPVTLRENSSPHSQEVEILVRNSGVPTAPPICEMPPPPPYSPHWSNIYEAIEPKPRHRWLFRIALCEFLLGISALAAAVICVIKTKYCPWYTGTWVAPIYIMNSIFGIIAAKRGSVNFFVGHLILCVLAIVGSTMLVGASIKNWLAMGVYPYDKMHPSYCALDIYDHNLIKYIYEYQSKFDFGGCVWELKMGLSMNSLLAFFGAVQGLLAFTSAILCCRRTCHCPCLK